MGSIPLDESIGLTKGKSFDVSQIYQRELTLQRAVKRGQSIAIPVAPSDVVIVALEPASTSTKRLPAIIWHNLGGTELKFAGQQLLITGLQGYQGEQRQIVVQIAGALPKQLLVNGQRIPFVTRGNTVLDEVRVEPAPPRSVAINGYQSALGRFRYACG